MAGTKGPFKEAMFKLAVRNRLADRLVKEQGYTRSEAREAVRELGDDVIEAAANRVEPDPKVPHGKFIDFLLNFIQSDAFKQLLDILLSLFGGAAVPVPTEPPPAPPA